MKIYDYVKQLLPNFDRHQVIETVEETRTQVDDTVLDTLKKLQTVYSPRQWKSKEYQSVNTAFGLVFPRLKSRPYFVSLEVIFRTISENLTYLGNQSANLFSRKITKESLTYRKTAVLQLLDLASFAGEYAGRQINYLIEAETSGRIQERFVQPQLDYLKQNERAFFQALLALYVPKNEFIQMLDSIPDITVDPTKAEVVQETVGARQLDPFRLGFVNQKFNPVYRWRIYRAEIQVKRHQERKATKQMLELRLLAMQEAAAGRSDPKIEQQMDYLAGRIQTLDYEITKFQERYAD